MVVQEGFAVSSSLGIPIFNPKIPSALFSVKNSTTSKITLTISSLSAYSADIFIVSRALFQDTILSIYFFVFSPAIHRPGWFND